MSGFVKTVFSNYTHVEVNCQTPITTLDSENDGSTCVDIQLAADSYYNYDTYLSRWTDFAKTTNGTSDMSIRPHGFAQFNENITIDAPWVNIVDVNTATQKGDRSVLNITLALPNVAVVKASQERINHIPQPTISDGFGAYSLRAAVPSPVVNVICASISEQELTPFVYGAWPNAQSTLNMSQWPYPQGPDEGIPKWAPTEWLNQTVLDEIFELGPEYGKERRMPVFPKYPAPYNTVINTTGWYINTVYLLGAASTSQPDVYTMCQVTARHTPNCST